MPIHCDILAFLLCWSLISTSHAFAPISNVIHAHRHVPSTQLHVEPAQTSVSIGSSTNAEMFPVLKKIQGIDWVGKCRYVGTDLKPASFVLRGGVRYELEKDVLRMTSFLTFPNGNVRQVIMEGKRRSQERASMRLDATGEGGPIYMVLTELAPDTILINEVEKASGKVIMTSSLSVVNGGKELVQVSHELGGSKAPVEGHQVWRLKKASWESGGDTEDNSFRDATGR